MSRVRSPYRDMRARRNAYGGGDGDDDGHVVGEIARGVSLCFPPEQNGSPQAEPGQSRPAEFPLK